MNNPGKMYIDDKHILSNLNVNDTNQKPLGKRLCGGND